VSESEFPWLIMSVADDIRPNPRFPFSSNHDVSTLNVLVVAVYHVWRTRHHSNATPPSRDVVGLNRPQEEEADQTMKYICETPYSKLSPSDAAKASEFRKIQNDDKLRILNDRPSKDVRITPIALLYSPFGEFLDHIRNPPTISDDVHLKNLEAAVDDFSSLMCQHYTNEETRRKTILITLNAIFECYHPSQLTHIIPSPVSGTRTSDGRANGPTGVLEVIVEFKNELGIGDNDPEVQITGYYMQSLRESLREQSYGRHRALHGSFLFPALGITLAGKGHKHDFFETLVVNPHTLFFSRFIYWIQCSCTYRSMPIC